MLADILRVGGVGALEHAADDLDGGADHGPGGSSGRPGRRSPATAPAARLEYLLIPLVFGLGAPLVALVGTNIGAGQTRRAMRIALIGGALAFAADRGDRDRGRAIWPYAWLRAVRA